jgi:hypothetical protein
MPSRLRSHPFLIPLAPDSDILLDSHNPEVMGGDEAHLFISLHCKNLPFGEGRA